MHDMVLGAIDLHGQKGAGVDVKGEARKSDTRSVERLVQLWREVQSGRRRRHGSRSAGEQGLVVFRIQFVDRTTRRDIGRNGRRAHTRKRRIKVGAGTTEGQRDLSALPTPRHSRLELRTEDDTISDFQAFGGTGESRPVRRTLATVKIDVDVRARSIRRPGFASAPQGS